MLKIDKTKPPDSKTWKTIDLGGGNTFDVLLKRPTWGELTLDQEQVRGFVETRTKKCLLDWRGISDENGQPIPYSETALEGLAYAFPTAVQMIWHQIGLLYSGLLESAEKNLQTPSDESPAGTAEKTGQTLTPTNTSDTAESSPSGEVSVDSDI